MKNAIFLFNTSFSVECTFHLNGIVKIHNLRYWSSLFHEVHTQKLKKLNLWAGSFGDGLVSPLIIPGNVTGGIYLDLLENAIDLASTNIIDNNPIYNLEEEETFQRTEHRIGITS